MIAIADFLDLADSIAAQAQALDAAMGTGVEATTASLGAVNNYERISALGVGEEETIIDLLDDFYAQLQRVTSIPNAYDRFGQSLMALKRHVVSFSTYLTAQGERVAPEVKTAIETLNIETLIPAVTFSPVVDPMGSLVVDGANSAVWTPGTDIDDDSYYAANLILKKTTAAGGANAVTVNLTCTKWDGTTEAKAVAVDASDAVDTMDDIGTHPGDKYKSITLASIVCAAGVAGEAWKVISELERAVAL